MVNGYKSDHDHDTLVFAHGHLSKLTTFDHLTTVTSKFWLMNDSLDLLMAVMLDFDDDLGTN